MATVRLFGHEYACEPVELRDDGLWVMKMRSHGPRWSAGGTYSVTQPEIVEMAAAETPIIRDSGVAALEVDMARERETLPTVQELIAGARRDGTIPNPKPPEPEAA